MSGRRTLLALATIAALASCRGKPPAPRPSEPDPDPNPMATVQPAPVDPGDGGVAPWPTLVRDEQWDAASRALDGLAEADRRRPEIRYVRARVALAKGRRRCGAHGAGRHRRVAAAAGRRTSPSTARRPGSCIRTLMWPVRRAVHAGVPASTRPARREKAKDAHRGARNGADHVLQAAKRTRTQEAERELRVRTGTRPAMRSGRTLGGWRRSGRTLQRRPTRSGSSRVDPAHPLTAQELFVRAPTRSRTQDGRTTRCTRSTTPSWHQAPRRSPTPTARGHAARRSTTRADGGSRPPRRSAMPPGRAVRTPRRTRSTPRGRRRASDRDDEAIRGYEDVRYRFAGSPWAEHAAFYVPYLRMLHGDWKEARTASRATCTPTPTARKRATPGGMGRSASCSRVGSRRRASRSSTSSRTSPTRSCARAWPTWPRWLPCGTAIHARRRALDGRSRVCGRSRGLRAGGPERASRRQERPCRRRSIRPSRPGPRCRPCRPPCLRPRTCCTVSASTPTRRSRCESARAPSRAAGGPQLRGTLHRVRRPPVARGAGSSSRRRCLRRSSRTRRAPARGGHGSATSFPVRR